MSRSRGGGTNVGAAPTTNNDDALLSQNDDDDENKLSIKVRSHDPVGEYAFSVSKTVRKYVFCVSISLSVVCIIAFFFPRFVTLGMDEAL
jgi:hypothetical protein